MATYIAASDGLLTGSIWGTVDATSLLDSEAANTGLTTSYVESAAFTPGAITIDGIAVKIATRTATPTATMSIRLAQGGALVAGTEVTINVSDILGTALLQNGWIFFKFAAPVLLVAATPYTVSAKASATTQVNLYRNATAGNWSRMLRTTTTTTLAAGDNAFILGEWTAAATKTDRTVTMDSTATTDYGAASTSLTGFGIGIGGTLNWQANAATTYVLQLSAILTIWVGGTMQMGTTGTPCPRDSSMTLQFDCAADGDFGLQVWGTLVAQGQSRIVGVTNHYVLLAADAAAAATSLTTDGQLSAVNGDDIAIASTTRTASQGETKTLNADAGATSLSLSAGLTNAHGGTSPVQAEVIGLKRAVRIVSVSSSNMTYVTFNEGASVDADWAEFRYIGVNTTLKHGLEWVSATGSFSLNKCVVRDSEQYGFYCNTAGSAGFSIIDTVFYATTNTSIECNIAPVSAYTVTGVVIVKPGTTGSGMHIESFNGTVQNCRVGGAATPYSFRELVSSIPQPMRGTFSGLVAHSSSSIGLTLSGLSGGAFSNVTIWRCSGAGISFAGDCGAITFDTVTLFGNTSANISFANSSQGKIVFRTCTSNGDSTFTTTNGVTTQGVAGIRELRFENSSFSVASGILTAHTTDINLGTGAITIELVLVNTTLSGGTTVGGTTSIIGRGFIAYQKEAGASGTNRREYPQLGTISYDTVTFRTASPSMKMAPNGAVSAFRLRSEPLRVAVGSGQSVTISVYANKSAPYAGSAPRLIVLGNAACGIAEATVATHGGSASSWVQLTGTVGPASEAGVLEFCVEVDGTTGQVNVDDVTASVA